MKQEALFETEKTPRKKKSSYRVSRNGNADFTPTFTDKKFVEQFDAFCRRNHLNKTKTAETWLIERLMHEVKEELNNMSKEELIDRIMEGNR